MDQFIDCPERTREWAIENNMFSLKTREGYWAPSGELLIVPSGIARTSRNVGGTLPGWTVEYRVSNGVYKRENFRDHQFKGDYKKSLEAAIKFLKKKNKGKFMRARSRVVLSCSDSRKMPELGVGITYQRIKEKRKSGKSNTHIHRFVLTAGGKSCGCVYIGTDVTWKKRFNEKLKIAKKRREEFHQQHLMTRLIDEEKLPVID